MLAGEKGGSSGPYSSIGRGFSDTLVTIDAMVTVAPSGKPTTVQVAQVVQVLLRVCAVSRVRGHSGCGGTRGPLRGAQSAGGRSECGARAEGFGGRAAVADFGDAA
jgi:hypothetical protein